MKDGPSSKNGESESTGRNNRERSAPHFGDLSAINFYHVLGVDQDADADSLAEAYARLRARHHSREEGSEALASEIVRYLDRVYAVLIDPERRRAYDALLIANGTSPNGSTNGAESTSDVEDIAQNGHSSLSARGPALSGKGQTVEGSVDPEPAPTAARSDRRRSTYATRDLTAGSIPKNLWFLAWPQMVSGSLQTLDTVWDLILAGRGFGTRAIAGLGAAQSWTQLVMTARFGLDTAARAMVSRAVGAGDMPTANHVALQSFTLSGGISLIVSTFGILFTEFLLRALGLSDEVIAQGAGYMRWQFVATATSAFMFMSGSVLQASGDTLTPMKAQIVTRVLDLALAPLLMFGWGFFPEIGLAGAAMANAVAQFVGIGMNFYALFSGTSRLHLSLQGYFVDWPLLWRILRIGGPASVTGMERALAQLILVGLVSPFGDTALAAYSLTSRVQMIANLGSMGVGQAAGIMVGQNLGAKRPDRAKKSVLWATGYVTIAQGLVIGLIVLFPTFFLSIFSKDAELVRNATGWLYIQAAGFFAMATSLVFQQSFNTAGDTLVPMVVTLISIWGVQQPLAIMLSGVASDWTIFGWAIPVPTVLNLGQYGIAWAIVLAVAVRLLIYVPYFIWGPWTKKEVFGGRELQVRGAH